jgi:hypothetical protein
MVTLHNLASDTGALIMTCFLRVWWWFTSSRYNIIRCFSRPRILVFSRRESGSGCIRPPSLRAVWPWVWAWPTGFPILCCKLTITRLFRCNCWPSCSYASNGDENNWEQLHATYNHPKCQNPQRCSWDNCLLELDVNSNFSDYVLDYWDKILTDLPWNKQQS